MGKGPSKYALEIRAETKRRKAAEKEQAAADALAHKKEMARRAQVAQSLGVARPKPTKFATSVSGAKLNRNQFPLGDPTLQLDPAFQARVHQHTHPALTPAKFAAERAAWFGQEISDGLLGSEREMVNSPAVGVPTAHPEAWGDGGLGVAMAQLADSEARAQLDALMVKAQAGTWRGYERGAKPSEGETGRDPTGVRVRVQPDVAELAHAVADTAGTSTAQVIKFGIALAAARVRNGERVGENVQNCGRLSATPYPRGGQAQLAA